MNTCPQCHSVYSEEYIYCLNDGTLLSALEGEQETVVNRRFDVLPPKGEEVVCAACGLANRGGSRFCKQCGGLLAGAPAPAGQAGFAFAGAAAAPGYDVGGEPAPTIDLASAGLFAPPRPSQANTATAQPNRQLIYVVVGVGIVLIIGIMVLLMMPKGNADRTSSAGGPGPVTKPFDEKKLPTSFNNRQYVGTVFNPRGDKTLQLALTRSNGSLTGFAYTSRTDRLDGSIRDDGSFELAGYDQQKRDVHTGDWTGTFSSDGESITGQWTGVGAGSSITFSLQLQH